MKSQTATPIDPEWPDAPIDPETGRPVRNWPTDQELAAPRGRLTSADDKDANGEWTTAALQRYGGCLICRTPFPEDCGCRGAS